MSPEEVEVFASIKEKVEELENRINEADIENLEERITDNLADEVSRRVL